MNVENKLVGVAQLPHRTRTYTSQGKADDGRPVAYTFSCQDLQFEVSGGKIVIEGTLELAKYRSRFKTVPNGPSWLPAVIHFILFWEKVWRVSSGWSKYDLQMYSREKLNEIIRSNAFKQNLILHEKPLRELTDQAFDEVKELLEIWEPYLLDRPKILRDSLSA